jgi:hypothetical protein
LKIFHTIGSACKILLPCQNGTLREVTQSNSKLRKDAIMKMDRNINDDGQGKYALVNLRKLRALTGEQREAADKAIEQLASSGVLEWGDVNTPDEFFPIKLKDKHAARALQAYADSIEPEDPEFASEVKELVKRAGLASPWCKAPD